MNKAIRTRKTISAKVFRRIYPNRSSLIACSISYARPPLLYFFVFFSALFVADIDFVTVKPLTNCFLSFTFSTELL
jgi:hypothetical protein